MLTANVYILPMFSVFKESIKYMGVAGDMRSVLCFVFIIYECVFH